MERIRTFLIFIICLVAVLSFDVKAGTDKKVEAFGSSSLLLRTGDNNRMSIDASGNILFNDLVTDQIPYIGASGALLQSALFTFNGTTLAFPLADGDILVGNVSNVATAVTMSGDVTIDNTGATDIGSGVQLNSPSVETPSRLDVKQDTFANLTTYASSATNGQFVFATDTKVMYQVIDNALVELGTGTGTASGGGQYKNFLDLDASNEDDETIFSDNSGNNATFDGGGALVGTLARITSSLINVTDTANFQFTQASGSLNDYFYADAFAVDESISVGIKFHYTYDGDDNDLELQLKCTTSGTIIYTQALEASASGVEPFTDNVYIPSGCGNLKAGFSVAVENIGAILKWNRFQFNNNPVVYKTTNDYYDYYIEQSQNALTDLNGEIEFNLGTANVISDGKVSVVATDDIGNTRTKFIANNKVSGVVCAHGIQTTANNTGTIIKYNSAGTEISRIEGTSEDNGAGISTAVCSPINLNQDEFFTISYSQNLLSNAALTKVSFSVTSPTENVITPLKKVSPVGYTTNAGQAVATATLTILDFEDLTYDSDLLVTTGASWKMTAKKSGNYKLSVKIDLIAAGGWNVAEQAELFVYKNGSLFQSIDKYKQVIEPVATDPSPVLQGEVTIPMEEDEFIDVRLLQDTGTNRTLSTSTGKNYINISKIDVEASLGAFPKSKFQTKYLTSDISTSTTVTDLGITNLIVNNCYSLAGKAEFESTLNSSFNLAFTNGATVIENLKVITSGAAQEVLPVSINTLFKAVASTITTTTTSFDVGEFIRGNGTKSETYIQIKEEQCEEVSIW